MKPKIKITIEKCLVIEGKKYRRQSLNAAVNALAQVMYERVWLSDKCPIRYTTEFAGFHQAIKHRQALGAKCKRRARPIIEAYFERM